MCKRRPRSLSNIKTKSLEIRAKKTPNVLDLKNIRPTVLTSKNCAHRLQKNTRKPFCRSYQRMVFTIFVGDDLQPKFRTKNFLGKFAEIPAKIFLTPKIDPLLRLCPLPPSIGLVYSTFIDQRSHFEKLLLLKIWL